MTRVLLARRLRVCFTLFSARGFLRRGTATMISQRIGHYIIQEKLGEGGMGVVYRAHDEKLRRDVALKFLGVLATGSSASHERVLQEARAISALNHPKLAAVYEVGEHEGRPY